MAKFGIALEWGSRGRWFESSHSDHPKTVENTTFSAVFLFVAGAEWYHPTVQQGGNSYGLTASIVSSTCGKSQRGKRSNVLPPENLQLGGACFII